MGKISVIIPTLNEEQNIGTTLRDIFSQTRVPDEVIVVDAFSRDKTLEEIKKFSQVQILQTNPSRAHQRNLGAKNATGDMLIFIDADSRIPKRFIERSVLIFKKRRLDYACPLYIPYKSTLQVNAIFFLYNAGSMLFQKIVPSGGTACMFVYRDIFLKEGGFNDAYVFEDLEFLRRLGRKYNYGVVWKKIYTSDRRFRTFGTSKVFLRYLLITACHLADKHKIANKVKYQFDKYKS